MTSKFFSSIIVLFLTVNGWSFHFDQNPDWCENNNIRGIEVKISEKYSVEAVQFKNSFCDDSYLINFIRYWPIGEGEGTYFSLKYGIVEGYDGGPYPAVLPTFIKRFEYFTTELIVVPVAVVFAIKIPI